MKDHNKKYNKFSKKVSKGGDSDSVAVNDNFAHIQPIQAQPLEVKVYNNNFDRALKAFRALVQKDRILSIYKEKQSYEKPSQKRRRKRNEAQRKLMELNYSTEGKHPKNKSFKKKDQAPSE